MPRTINRDKPVASRDAKIESLNERILVTFEGKITVRGHAVIRRFYPGMMSPGKTGLQSVQNLSVTIQQPIRANVITL